MRPTLGRHRAAKDLLYIILSVHSERCPPVLTPETFSIDSILNAQNSAHTSKLVQMENYCLFHNL